MGGIDAQSLCECMRLGTISCVICVGYCRRGELDVIRSLISLYTPALANATVDHEDKTTRSENFEKDIAVGEQLVWQNISQSCCVKGRPREAANVRDGWLRDHD